MNRDSKQFDSEEAVEHELQILYKSTPQNCPLMGRRCLRHECVCYCEPVVRQVIDKNYPHSELNLWRLYDESCTSPVISGELNVYTKEG
jgi:hypothetical protein